MSFCKCLVLSVQYLVFSLWFFDSFQYLFFSANLFSRPSCHPVRIAHKQLPLSVFSVQYSVFSIQLSVFSLWFFDSFLILVFLRKPFLPTILSSCKDPTQTLSTIYFRNPVPPLGVGGLSAMGARGFPLTSFVLSSQKRPFCEALANKLRTCYEETPYKTLVN